MTERLSRHAALHPKRMVAIWIGIFVLSIASIALLLPSAITTDATVTNDPESQQGYDAMFQHLPPSGDNVNEVVLVRAPGKDVDDRPAGAERDPTAGGGARGDRAHGAGPLLPRRPGSRPALARQAMRR